VGGSGEDGKKEGRNPCSRGGSKTGMRGTNGWVANLPRKIGGVGSGRRRGIRFLDTPLAALRFNE